MNVRGAAVVLAVLAAAATARALDPELRKLAKDPDAARRADAARALARAGTPDAARVLVELMADKEPRVRDVAVLACDIVTDPESVRALASGAKSRDDLTRRNCAEALGRTKKVEALPELALLATKDSSAQVRADALDALWGMTGSPKAFDVAKEAAGDKDPFVRAAAIEALRRVAPAADVVADLVRRALADADDGVRCVAWTEWRQVARDAALAAIGDAAKDPSWRVRAQCVEDAAWLHEKPAIAALVALVGDKVTRVAAAAHRALVRLTGKEIGRDADLWRAWWAANRDSWIAPLDIGKDVPDDPRKTTAHYHGVDVVTDAAAFVVDLSGSMKEPAGGAETSSRWAVAADELRTTLGALPDTFVANVVFFHMDVFKAFPRAQPLTKAARERAEAFIASGSPGQRGNLLAGVLAALDEDAIDTVYVLSDGAPTEGDFVEASRVRAAIRQRNRVRKCVIDTIGFGARKPTERAFMEGIAGDSGGRCVFRGDGGK